MKPTGLSRDFPSWSYNSSEGRRFLIERTNTFALRSRENSGDVDESRCSSDVNYKFRLTSKLRGRLQSLCRWKFIDLAPDTWYWSSCWKFHFPLPPDSVSQDYQISQFPWSRTPSFSKYRKLNIVEGRAGGAWFTRLVLRESCLAESSQVNLDLSRDDGTRYGTGGNVVVSLSRKLRCFARLLFHSLGDLYATLHASTTRECV